MRAKQLKDLGPPEDVEYIERERHAVAVHEACHAVVAFRTRQHMEIDIATIEKGSDYLGMVASIPPEDQFTRWRSEYEADILVSLASLAGRADVLRRRLLVRVSPATWSRPPRSRRSWRATGAWAPPCRPTPRRAGSRSAAPAAAAAGRRRARAPRRCCARRWPTGSRTSWPSCSTEAEAILRENRAGVLAVAHALETHKTLTGEDVEAVLDGRARHHRRRHGLRRPGVHRAARGVPRGGGRARTAATPR